MYNFTYDIPTKVHFGKGQVEKLGPAAAEYGKTALLVYGGGSIKKNGIYADVTAQLDAHGITYVDLGGVEPNPRYTSVDKGVALCREHGVDMIIAIGGGSSIDCAKVISCATFYDGPSWDLMTKKAQPEKFLPIMAVLTLSATGSEMDCGAVISNMETNQKLFLAHPQMRPKVAILDPTYTYSVPKNQTAAGTADIISHVLETYFSPETDFGMLDRICEGLLKTCLHYGPIAIEQPDNYEARANLMWASSWGINDMIGYGKRGPWTVHPIEHQLSAYYDVTHGVGLAILTPAWMRYVLSDATVGKFAEYAVNVFGMDATEEPYALAEKAISATYDAFAGLGIPMRLRDIGIPEDSLEVMAKSSGGVKGGYVPLDVDDVLAILKACY
ncbi:MAG: iron-containing alcohol dehydrogenase [Christensenellaceae bacterium]|nr:iron-containing alcohol dehydrogenase [Christensenellaceae bacterium]